MIGAILVAAGAAVAVWVLLGQIDQVRAEDAPVRIDAIRTGLTVGAGLGAALVLALSVRRQMLGEATYHTTMHDGLERRRIDTYAKAVDHLGAERTVMKLGGLYALESLAHEDAQRRPAVVDVLCAYLRLPFVPPNDVVRLLNQTTMSAFSQSDKEAYDELQVRLVVQQILGRHLSIHADAAFWADTRIDLTGALLVNFTLAELKMTSVRVRDAQFVSRDPGAYLVALDEQGLEQVARGTHAAYQLTKPDAPAWDDLGPGFQQSNIETARELQTKLRAINCGLATFDRTAVTPTPLRFTDNEVEVLAAVEHERWLVERVSDGWVYGERRLDQQKRNPNIVPFEKLPGTVRDESLARERDIPRLLIPAGFEVRRLPWTR